MRRSFSALNTVSYPIYFPLSISDGEGATIAR
jgi:hypothetical protein